MSDLVRTLFLLSVVTVASSEEGNSSDSSPPPPRNCSHPNLPFAYSIFPFLLQAAAGLSQPCLSTALDACSSAPEVDPFSEFIEEARETLWEVKRNLNKSDSRPRHCKDLLDAGDAASGVRLVYPYPEWPDYQVAVYCNQDVDGGGWTAFQRRINITVREDFFRTWIEYRLGFGDLEGEFWLGLDLIHQLTSLKLQELRIDLYDYEGEQRWAKYGTFYVGPLESNYRLAVGRFTGDAGDGLLHTDHQGAMFSTHDSDYDTHPSNCAQSYRGGWWYGACHISNLNGYQYEGEYETYADGITWKAWHGYHYSLRQTMMMTRPAF